MVQQLDEVDMSHIYELLKPSFSDGSWSVHPEWTELYSILDTIGKNYGWVYTVIQINRNFVAKPHKDAPAVGNSYLFSCGDYTGGELVVEGVAYNAFHRPTIFNGPELLHWNNPAVGDKFTVLYWNKI
jgi:hypothetical protein